MATAQVVNCYCNECRFLLCTSLNNWVEVSTSYSTYAGPGSLTDPGLELVQQIREGSRSSELEGCLVKPLRCHSCRTRLGVRCVEAPREKQANVNRSYLKLTKMTMMSMISDDHVEANIKQRQGYDLGTSSKNNSIKALAHNPNGPRPKSSRKRRALREREDEVRDTEASSPDHVFDSIITPSDNPLAALKEQKRNIDRILARIDNLQEDMTSLRKAVDDVHDRRDQASKNFATDVGLLTSNLAEVGSRLNELDALKLDMKMMQQRIKRIDGSRSTGQQSSAALGAAPLLKQPSPTVSKEATPHDNALLNDLQTAAAQTPISTDLKGLVSSQMSASREHDLPNGRSASFKGTPFGSTIRVIAPHRQLASKSRPIVNGLNSRGSHTPVDMPPPQIPHNKPDQNNGRRRSSIASTLATPSSVPRPTSLRRVSSQIQDSLAGPRHEPQESHIYDDELVEDVRPRSSTGSSTESILQSRNKDAHSPDLQLTPTAQRPLPKTKGRKSVPMAIRAPGPSNENKPDRSRTNHNDRKRRKTTDFPVNAPTTPIWADGHRESNSRSGQRDERALLITDKDEVGGRSARSKGTGRKSRRKPGPRDRDGYLLNADGTRNYHSVTSIDRWKRKKVGA